ncbi:hypothetical protein LINGRAPRIM_LOCUS2595 [Linum grandiflorum]
MEARLRTLTLAEEEEHVGEVDGSDPTESIDEDLNLYLVGRFLTELVFNFDLIKERLVEIWRPKSGLTVTELADRRLLFRFYHRLDLRWVADGGRWHHNGCLLVLH